jgi:hypothetical protein
VRTSHGFRTLAHSRDARRAVPVAKVTFFHLKHRRCKHSRRAMQVGSPRAGPVPVQMWEARLCAGRAAVQDGALDPLFALLRGTDKDAQKHAARCLANLSENGAVPFSLAHISTLCRHPSHRIAGARAHSQRALRGALWQTGIRRRSSSKAA